MKTTTQKLRFWKLADAGWLRDLDVECFPAPDASFFNGANHHWWVVVTAAGDPIAYASVEWDKGSRSAAFGRCGVAKEHRGKGVHGKLIRHRLRWLRARGVKTVRTYVTRDNTKSLRNLKTHGFTIARRSCGGEYVHLRMDLRVRKGSKKCT